MVFSLAENSVDEAAAVQIAHAITQSTALIELEYFGRLH
jgi:hypothetical protein